MSNIVTQTNTNRIGITLTGDVIEKIDVERGDIARSRYILRLIEASINQDKKG
jgi:metal-responsive CopG/Arc/MetJ family transcriptional regulator